MAFFWGFYKSNENIKEIFECMPQELTRALNISDNSFNEKDGNSSKSKKEHSQNNNKASS